MTYTEYSNPKPEVEKPRWRSPRQNYELDPRSYEARGLNNTQKQIHMKYTYNSKSVL